MRPDARRTTALGLAFVAAVAAAAWLWGRDVVDVILVAGFLLLLADRVGLNERFDDTRADVDQIGDDVGDIRAHLTGNENPSTGRHASADTAPHYRPNPSPRSDT